MGRETERSQSWRSEVGWGECPPPGSNLQVFTALPARGRDAGNKFVLTVRTWLDPPSTRFLHVQNLPPTVGAMKIL